MSHDGFNEAQLAQLEQLFTPIIERVVAAEVSGPEDPGLLDDFAPEPEDLIDGDPVGDNPELDPSPVPDDDNPAVPYFRNKLAKHMAGDCDAEAMQRYMAGMDDDDRAAIDRYMSGAEDAERDCYAMLTGAGDEPEADQYSRGGKSDKYAKLLAENRRLKEEVDESKAKADQYAKDRRAAERRATLENLEHEGVLLDVDEELEATAGFGDEQFEKHAERIADKYQRVPVHQIRINHAAKDPDANEGEAKSKAKKYSKIARDRCLKLQQQGKKADFKAILAEVTAAEGQTDEEAA